METSVAGISTVMNQVSSTDDNKGITAKRNDSQNHKIESNSSTIMSKWPQITKKMHTSKAPIIITIDRLRIDSWSSNLDAHNNVPQAANNVIIIDMKAPCKEKNKK